jgi:protein AFG1
MLIHSWGGPGIVQSLQDLHDMLKEYHPAALVHPRNEPRTRISRWSLGFLFGPRSPKKTPSIPPNLPKGLYMYGDVGSGKTMLMDLFYDTLPANIQSRTRIHFHNFMQDVHKRLHAMKAELGNDLDAIKYVAADIAEKGRVLCFDEFQCTDVADAMILRRFVRPNP